MRLDVHACSIPALPHRPSLSRWPRLSEVTLWLDGDLEEGHGSLSSQLVLPFVDQPEEALARITTMAVHVVDGDKRATLPPPTFMQLASLLPNLRDLDLSNLRGGILPTAAVDLRLFYRGLSQLRSLEVLSLPTATALPGIEALAGSLQKLVADGWSDEEEDEDDTYLSARAVASLSQLTKLSYLMVRGAELGQEEDEGGPGIQGGGQASGGLLGLLDAMPPALESILWGTGDADELCVALRKGDGRWALTVCYCATDDLIALAGDVLVPCRALRSAERPRLILENITATAMDEQDEEMLVALAQLYDISMETELVVDSSCGLEDLQPVLSMLSNTPAVAVLGFPSDHHRYTISFSRPDGGPQQAGTGPRPLTAPGALLELALERLAGCEPIPNQRSYNWAEEGSVLLLRGPAAAALSQLGPAALSEWALRVERGAEAAALAAGAGQAEGGGSGVLLSGVQALPPAAALLVECGEAEGAGAAVAAALEGEGLQVVSLCRDAVVVDEGTGAYPSAKLYQNNLHWGLTSALHAAWGAALPITTLSERLEWVLAVREMLKELPAFVEAA
ncbi:hypothetical protein HYH03_005533 [Edaphochlamys debaryana]|uniref:Uncharacterized protein n=1 Tax=Edaphochlamys debaryana TaxID=47281 RepID=A0A836C127_9CHLO|nr:hypothetical protein HYH03_005533 [Edaphochlamys debaryana]|eukprot:KAG2496300.1 hypothetical protein HYH03_005533 [Edaphochlamys debaryana]